MKFSSADNDQSLWGEAAMGEGKKPKARRVVASQSSKVSICMVLRIKLVAELQMMLPSGCRTPMMSAPFLSLRRYHLILFDSQPNKIANLPFP